MRNVRTSGSGKSKKTYTDVLTLTLDPEAGWMEDQLTGCVATFSGNVALADALEAMRRDSASAMATADKGDIALCQQQPINVDTFVSARRNPFGDNDEAKAMVATIRAAAPKSVVDANGLTWKFAVSDKGVATMSRTTGSGKNKKTTSATAVVEMSPGDDGYVFRARFTIAGKFVEVEW